MSKKSDKLQRIVKKLSRRYGAEDADVQRLQLTLDALEADKKLLTERRSLKFASPVFMTRAKQLYYAAAADNLH